MQNDAPKITLCLVLLTECDELDDWARSDTSSDKPNFVDLVRFASSEHIERSNRSKGAKIISTALRQ